jgi:hypothetical protein
MTRLMRRSISNQQKTRAGTLYETNNVLARYQKTHYDGVMPVASETSRIQYSGNGSSVTPYSVPFYFLNTVDIKVVLADASGTETLLTETTHYALMDAGNPTGGSLTTVAAYDNTHTLTIYREPQQTQSAEFQSTGALPADTLTRGLDRLTMLVQSLGRKLGRCFRLNDKAGDVAALSEAARANTVFGFDVGGDPVLRDRTTLLSLLSLEGSMQNAPTAFWANSGERALKVPDFVGQLGVQLDTSAVYRSTGTSAGNWAVLSMTGMAGQLALGNVPDALVTYAKLQNVAASQRVLGRNSGGAGVAEEVSLSQLLDWVGSAAQGDILYRGASSWQRLPAGTAGLPLITKGAGQNPAWAAPTSFASGSVVRKVVAKTTSSFTTAAIIPLDDTVPQSGEGLEVLTQSYTPLLPNSSIVVRVSCLVDGSGVLHIMGALFVDAVTNAFAAADTVVPAAGYSKTFNFVGVYDNTTLAAKVFKLRLGCSTGTAYVNRYVGGELFGSASFITMEIEEIAP